jgi:hypothetical protein
MAVSFCVLASLGPVCANVEASPAPLATTGTPSEVTETSATLNGNLDPAGGGAVTACRFEYVTETAFEQGGYSIANVAACSPAPPYSVPTAVGAHVEGLIPSSVYHYRLRVANFSVVAFSPDATFAVPPGPPQVNDESSSEARASTVVLGALVNPFGRETTCQVQYVDDAGFRDSGYAAATTRPCTPFDLGSSLADQAVTATLSGLAIDTVYHYRFLAENQAGATVGADQTFATFGIEAFGVEVLDGEGRPETQAGAHPYQLTSDIAFNTTTLIHGGESDPSPDENVKDVQVELPPGLLGNPTAAARCTRALVPLSQCPGDSQVGILFAHTSAGDFEEPVYDLVAPAGDAAELGARISNSVTAYIDFHVRTGGDYGVTAEALNISANAGVFSVLIDVWGVPGDPSHDGDRFCPGLHRGCSTGAAPLPFLRSPTSCAGAQASTARIDSWQHPQTQVSATSTVSPFTGCERLDFTPSLSVVPDTEVAGSSGGLHLELSLPQSEDPRGLAEADLKDATVALPVGVTVNPALANGLVACSPAQIGLHDAAKPECPDASKVGSVDVDTPLLPNPLRGSIYVAKQGENPFGSLLAIYLTAEDPLSGVSIKLAGHISADPLTGQLTTTFADNPQAPFSHFKLDLTGGSHGALLMPASCGAYATASTLAPWSGAAAVDLVEPFTVDEGCASGFSPNFFAGARNPRAGAFSPFSLSLSRGDSEQRLQDVRLRLPPGATAKLAGVALCPDADAALGTCPQASQIGAVAVSSGAGLDPVLLMGKIYLTGPYNGGPFGEATVVPAVAGPFDLGDVVVRGSIRVDAHTGQVTVVSDPFPQMVGQTGIPTDVRRVDVSLDRPGFTLNPTSCEPMRVTATATSLAGAEAALAARYQVGGCGELPFKPSLAAITKAKHSRTAGEYLHVIVKSKGGQANIASVHVALPKALPSRLSTLKLACSQGQFDLNPAGCPSGSFVGAATARTPLLPVPLTGPAIFVSHGGAQFPDLDLVLQGDGVEIVLTGKTFISRAGVTSSTFSAVPDVPVERFDLVLPAGRHSALTTSRNLCRTKLVMPTTIVGQNGAVVKQRIKLAVSGCRTHTVRRRVRARHGGRRA